MRTCTKRLGLVSASLTCLALFGALALGGCGGGGGGGGTGTDGGPTPGDDAGADAADAAVCAPGGTGSLTIVINGLPAGVAPHVVIDDESGVLPIDSARTLPSSPSGNYTIIADTVAAADPIVRTAYKATVSDPTFCLAAGGSKTVTVTYALVATSNKLWMTNQDGASGDLAAFASSSIQATGSPAASVNVKGPAGRHLTFDRDGNMWTMGPTTADPALVRFAADSLGSSGTKTPDRKIALPGLTCIPGLTDLSFDATGNMWLTSACAKNVVRLTPSDIAADGNVTPAVAITGLQGPDGIAFDAAGNLWVSDNLGARLLRYDAARLTASTADTASLSIDAQATLGGLDLNPGSLAFDAAGNLWVTSFGGNVIYKMTLADQAGTGTKTLVPSVQMTVQAGALLESIAFDESGGLWLTYSQGKVARIAPADLTTSTNAGAPTVPAIITTSADLMYADGLAFYPAPAALPLYHRLP